MRILLPLLLALLPLFAHAQSGKVDIVHMLNGTEHRGKVTKVTEAGIGFVHEDEVVEYSYKRDEIFKIDFASGRQEVFNAMQSTEGGASAMSPVRSDKAAANSVAILPFRFISDASPAPNPELARQIQDECFRLFNSAPSGNVYQDPMKTNALLLKHGIPLDEVRDHLSDELCSILGVEKVVMGVVARNTKGTSTNTTKGGYTGIREKSDTKTNIWNVQTGNSTTTVNYETSITMTLMDRDGNRLYDKERTSFWNTSDAYKVTLSYLWKRSPLYIKP
ncbi:MAG TPA: hypothetical protein PKE21_03805 [Flavobacteriales bacterium]|nr:hypothetical protein [Flavobacteriales bacterium]HMR26581.1 hypothetical protein [Flavobacteriales bacterium]